MLELAVHLVAEHDDPALARHLYYARERGAAHQCSRRIVRLVEVEHTRLGPQQRLQRFDVVRPAVLEAPVPTADLGAGAARQLQPRLVTRRLDDGVVAGVKQRVVEQEDPLLGAGDDDHLVRVDALVHRGDRLAELRRAGRLGVATPRLKQPRVGVGLELEQVRDRA